MQQEQPEVERIDPARLYSAREACALIPSTRPGRRIHRITLHRLVARGDIEGVAQRHGRRTHWFVWGSAILRYLGADRRPEWSGRTPALSVQIAAEAEKSPTNQ